MRETYLFSKTKRKLAGLLVIYLLLAAACFGFVLFTVFSKTKEEEVLDLSELVSNGQVEEGLCVGLDVEVYPTLMLPKPEEGSPLYFVTDVNGHVYIAELSKETYSDVIDTINGEKEAPVYHLEGVTVNIDEQVMKMALSNGDKVFKDGGLNRDSFSEYLDGFYIKDNRVSERMVTIYQIAALLGVFFLVMALGHIVPAMVRINKGDFGVLDEKKMMRDLGKNLPDRESLTAGVYGVGVETEIKQVFGKCRLVDEKLVPDENGAAIQVTKGKRAKFEVYVGVSQNYLILAECKEYQHFYQFDNSTEPAEAIDTSIPIQDIGNCFPLAEIQACTVKRAGKGDVNCTITMKNGGFIKLSIPRNGGIGMPNHEKYREELITCLRDKI